MIKLAPDVRLRTLAVERLMDEGGHLVARICGTDEAGGEFEIAWHAIFTLSAGQIRRLKFLGIDDRSAAEARFEALTAAIDVTRGPYAGTGGHPE